METNQVREVVKGAYSKIARFYQNSYEKINESDWAYWDTFASACIGEKVLDMGCGIGDATRFMLKKGIFPCGLDFSEEMLNIAKKQKNEIIWVKGDICNCPFPDHSFKGIVISYTINHLSDEMLLQLKMEVDRLLVNNGILLLVYHVGKGEEVRTDPIDDSVSIYFHYYQKEELDKLFSNYEKINFYQRCSIDKAELTNDKAIATYIKK